MIPIILASASPRRRELLAAMGIIAEIRPSRVDETQFPVREPRRYALQLARAKADAVAREVTAGIIIAADTIVVHRGRIIGKPRDRRDACRILTCLSGTTHNVYTALACVALPYRRWLLDIDAATVLTRALSPRVIAALAEKHLDKAGAYAVQETNDRVVRHIRGNYDTVVGLPCGLLANMLRVLTQAPRWEYDNEPLSRNVVGSTNQ